MSRHPSQRAGIFILHLALQNTLPKVVVFGAGRNHWLKLKWRIECASPHRRPGEDFAFAEQIQRLFHQPRKQFGQHDEANVAVLRPRPRFRH